MAVAPALGPFQYDRQPGLCGPVDELCPSTTDEEESAGIGHEFRGGGTTANGFIPSAVVGQELDGRRSQRWSGTRSTNRAAADTISCCHGSRLR